ncbi:hypothetical protein SLS63_003458 [Diaporthe eres]|uniref:Putative gamma-glutamylcyclotransferase n=1 Tax=Diaporthe eres TaxID=83184 RepID=A0ABR1PGX5_DIAER
MKTSSEEKNKQARADETTCAPLLLFQPPPNDDSALMIPKPSVAEDADTDREEHERNRAQAAEDKMAEEQEGIALYFFYGSLMDPSVLRRVLNLAERPRLRPASIVGYHVKMWGPYPALTLTDEAAGPVVRGMAYEIKGSKKKDRLAAYETGNYREHKCLVSVDGSEEKVFGNTFVWAGDDALLKEGSFDLRDWQQMYSI